MMDDTRVTVVATLPPPVTGNTLVTKFILEALGDLTTVRVCNWSTGGNNRNTAFRIGKAFRVVLSLWRIVSERRWPGETLYTVACGGHGLYWNLLTVGLARLRGFRCVLHHHSYTYIRKKDWRMACLDKWMGKRGIHVFLCECMASDFEKNYDVRAEYVLLPSTVVLSDSDSEQSPTFSSDGVFRLGMLSNLTIEKGLDLAIETFRKLRERFPRVELHLAGPTASAKERAIIDQAICEYGDAVTYYGAVYDKDKMRFYNDIDVFLFPTRYQVEVQPVVIAEAFSHGKPVIAYGRACIPELIGDAGCSVPLGQDYVEIATQTLASWLDDQTLFCQYRDRVRIRAKELRDNSQRRLSSFLNLVVQPERALVKSTRDVKKPLAKQSWQHGVGSQNTADRRPVQ